MKKIYAFIMQHIGPDGLLHFSFSAIAAFIISFFLFWWLAFIAVFIVGIAKEVYDLASKKGCAEWKDILCDIAGALVGSL